MTLLGKTTAAFTVCLPFHKLYFCVTEDMQWLHNKLAIVFVFPFLSYSRETYNALTNWLTDARTLASPNIVIILCGNKKDLDADREVTFLEASRFAQENGN